MLTWENKTGGMAKIFIPGTDDHIHLMNGRGNMGTPVIWRHSWRFKKGNRRTPEALELGRQSEKKETDLAWKMEKKKELENKEKKKNPTGIPSCSAQFLPGKCS